MFWKKNVFSYVLWIALAAITVSGLYGLVANITSAYQMPSYGNLLIAVAYCLVAYAIMLFVRNLIEDKFYKVCFEKRTIVLLEMLGVVLSIAVGFGLRLWELDGKVSDSIYFMHANTGNSDIPAFVHGAGYLFAYLLRLSCIVFGNRLMSGVLLQLFLYSMAFLCLYFSVRALAGKMSAFFVFFIGFCATYMRKDAMILSPTALILLLIAILMLFISIAIQKEASFLWYLPIGFLTGVCGYLDCLCFLPLISLFVFGLREDEEYEEDLKDKLIRFLSFSLMTAFGFSVMLFGDMFISGASLERLLWAYSFANFGGDSSVAYLTTECKSVGEMTVFFGILTFAPVGFILDKHKERITGWTLSLMVLLVVQALGIGNQYVDINIFLLIYGAVLCGIGISSFWIFERLPIRQTEFIMNNIDVSSMDSADNLTQSQSEKINDHDKEKKSVQRYTLKIDPPEGMTMEEVEFIENPLPLPKKHVSKNLDYDIDVPDDDDFDI